MAANPLMTALSNIIKFCSVSNNNDASLAIPTCQVSYYGKSADALIVSPYGYYYQPSINSLGIVANIDGNESKLAVTANDYSRRPRDIKPGEVIIGPPDTGILIKLTIDGVLQISSPEAVDIDSPNITVNSSNVTVNSGNITLGEGVSITGSTVELGGGGAPVARVGDIVVEDPVTGVMTITTGSASVTSA